ncbi:hypothetical protein ACH5RR_010135 [Cinchona calisaya]|uniref:Copper transport protein n=1 Tax=Cinchona calisaya TaxID=153742 RepID=A0ABD3AHK2_9GENT
MEAHLTFFRGDNWESVIFYILNLFGVFVMSILVEWLSHTRLINSDIKYHVVAGLVQTGLYSIRITLAYFVMLKVMSFDVGVLAAAVAGYTIGFLIFGSRMFDKQDTASYQKPTDLPPLNC